MFKSKVVVPETSETCLDLIRNADPTGLADFFINGGQIPLLSAGYAVMVADFR